MGPHDSIAVGLHILVDECGACVARCAGNSCEANALTRRPAELAAQLLVIRSWRRCSAGGDAKLVVVISWR